MVDQGPLRSACAPSPLFREHLLRAIDQSERTIETVRKEMNGASYPPKLDALNRALETAMNHKEALLAKLQESGL